MSALPFRLLLALGAVAATVALVAGCGGQSASPPPPAEGAAPGKLLVAPGGLAGSSCTADDPCKSLDEAYRAAEPGQVVELAAGTYPEQKITAVERTGAPVVFRPVPGAEVKIAGIELFVGGIELRNLEVAGVMTHEHANGVTLRNVKIAGGLFILSSARVRILGGSVGGGIDYHPMIAAENATPPRDVLIDGVVFHDWTRTNEGVHTECLQIGAGIGITIRNSTFRNCDVFGLMISTFGAAGAPRNLTIENNVFDAAGDGGYYSVRFSEAAPVWRNVLVRNNSALQPFNVDPKPRKVNFRMIGNLAPLEPWGCVGGISYAYNVWQGVRCGTTDVNGRLGFENTEELDLRLKPGAAGIDVVQKNFAATDIDGRARPAGEAGDAGAHESP